MAAKAGIQRQIFTPMTLDPRLRATEFTPLVLLITPGGANDANGGAAAPAAKIGSAACTD
jgi:hypothetical protein